MYSSQYTACFKVELYCLFRLLNTKVLMSHPQYHKWSEDLKSWKINHFLFLVACWLLQGVRCERVGCVLNLVSSLSYYLIIFTGSSTGQFKEEGFLGIGKKDFYTKVTQALTRLLTL